MPPKAAARPKPAAAEDRGMLVLQQKLSILNGGPGRTRRNPALDVLIGRVPDERLVTLRATLSPAPTQPSAGPMAVTPTPAAQGPTAMVLPVAAIRMAAVARSARPAPSPWLSIGSSQGQTRLKLITPPRSRWSRVPWLGPLVEWLTGTRSYKSSARSRRARLAS